MPTPVDATRRRLLAAATAGLGLAACADPSRAARQLLTTPPQTPGPFYPAQLPLDRDNDLVTVDGQAGQAQGEIVELTGRVLDDRGQPIGNARIEIWQCNAFGRYHHPRDRRDAPLDPGFQGYGQFVTSADGGYRFRTIRPVPYPGRTPHIHVAVQGPGFERLVSQIYVKGEPGNNRDFLFNALPPAARQRVLVDFQPAPTGLDASRLGRFDLVLPNFAA